MLHKLLETIQCALEIFDNIQSQFIRCGQAVQVRKRFVLDPEDIQTGFIPVQNFLNGEFPPAAIRVILRPCLMALMPVLRMEAGDKILQIGVRHGMLLQREMDVGAEVVHPHLFRLPLRAGGALVKENHVCLDARLIENPSGQAQDRVQIGSLQELPAHRLASPALEEHVVRYDHRRFAPDVQERVDVLDKIQLLVGAGGPEVGPVVDKVFLLLLPLLIGEGDGGLLSERRIGQHVVHSVAGGGQQRIPQGNGGGSVDVSDVVEVQIHQCGFVGGWYNLTSIKGLIFQKFFLLPIQGVSFRVGDVFLSGKEKSDAATA